jgi:hypothetical protein
MNLEWTTRARGKVRNPTLAATNLRVSLYWCVCRLLRQSKKLIDIVGEPGKATGKPGSFS